MKLPRPAVKKSALALTPSSLQSNSTTVRLGEIDKGSEDRDEKSHSDLLFRDISNTTAKASFQERGRPVQAAMVDDPRETEGIPMKKRGRKSAEVTGSLEESQQTQPPRKKRGRPPKSGREGSDEDQPSNATDAKQAKMREKSAHNDKTGAAEIAATRRSSRAAAASAKASITIQSVSILPTIVSECNSDMSQITKQSRQKERSSVAASKGSKSTRVRNRRARGRPRGHGKSSTFEVEKLIAMKNDKKGEPSYLVKWANYDDTESTWEPLKNLTGCMKLVRAFGKNAKQTRPKPKNK
jgi:hypothetical protein